ncbi:helix-turn-helix transcriptional regulator [Marinobacterium arenosum]|uniref:helix-turn-helix transcriptional regulator n=1 Tax=Marinobacterium arenosum TaxID=2862496 RepID=UPI0036F3CCFC
MSSDLSKKIRCLRDSEGLGRKVFAERLGISQRTLESIENKGTDPASSILQMLCKLYPQYTFWLTIGEVKPDIGQIRPPLEQIIDDYRETGTDTK